MWHVTLTIVSPDMARQDMLAQEEDAALLAALVLCVEDQHVLRKALSDNGLVSIVVDSAMWPRAADNTGPCWVINV